MLFLAEKLLNGKERDYHWIRSCFDRQWSLVPEWWDGFSVCQAAHLSHQENNGKS